MGTTTTTATSPPSTASGDATIIQSNSQTSTSVSTAQQSSLGSSSAFISPGVNSSVSATTLPASSTAIANSDTLMKKLARKCTSQRISVVLAFVAFGIGIYYYYGQYNISWKTWRLGVWKDCRDREGIADSAVCQQLANTTYDQISSRSLHIREPASHSPGSWLSLTKSDLMYGASAFIRVPFVRTVVLSLDCFLLTIWFSVIAIIAARLQNGVTDITLNHPSIPRAYWAVFAFVNTSVGTMCRGTGVIAIICGCASIVNFMFYFNTVSTALKTCVKSRHTPATIHKWKSGWLWELRRGPDLYVFVTGPVMLMVSPYRYLYKQEGTVDHGHHGVSNILSEGIPHFIRDLYIITFISLLVFVILLSAIHQVILRTPQSITPTPTPQRITVNNIGLRYKFVDQAILPPDQMARRRPKAKNGQ